MPFPVRARQADHLLKPDFHAHTTASDGVLSPVQLVREAVLRGLNLLAITDHDTLKGLYEANLSALESGINLINGIEISTAGEDEVHVLGYFVRGDMEELNEATQKMCADRQSRCPKFLARFNELGLPLTLEDLQIPEGTDCNRPHIARALVRKHYVSSVQEAFDRYLAVGRPGYIARLRFETEEIIAMFRREGAVPVLAHPELIIKQTLKSPERIKALKVAGLMGIEAWHSKHSKSACLKWVHTAGELGLLVTGGSDFHQHRDTHGELGSMLTWWENAHEDAVRLLNATNAMQYKG
jgi:predicted metal-dependent phosphoesterase TrpH